jgi:short subunit fatty acids transporter
MGRETMMMVTVTIIMIMTVVMVMVMVMIMKKPQSDQITRQVDRKFAEHHVILASPLS